MVIVLLGKVDVWKSFETDDGDCGINGSDQKPREVEATGGGFDGKFILHLKCVAGFHCPKFYAVVVAEGQQAAHFSDPEDAADGRVMHTKANHVAGRALNGNHIATC